jgi:hypothetical protein
MQTCVLSAREKRRGLNGLIVCGAALAAFAGYSSRADAQFTYSSTVTAATLTVGTFISGTSFNGTPVMTGTATDGAITTTGNFSAGYGNGNGLYLGAGSSDLGYTFDPTGIVASIGLSGTADSLVGDGDANNDVVTVPSAGIGTDFMVATTGAYTLTGLVNFGGRASAQFGALFLTYTVTDDTDHSGFSLDDNLQDENPTPDMPLSVSELVNLTAGDRYTLSFGASLNPATASDSAPLNSMLTGSAEMSLTVVPEPASLAMLGLMGFSLAARRRRVI